MVQAQKLVGDIVTTLANGASRISNARLDFAIRTMARIRAAETSGQAKLWAAQTMAVPRMLPSSLWAKPLDSRLKVLRTAIIGTVISRKRSHRCPEIVVSVCLNPLRADPKSALLYKTLLDARRLLKKSPERAQAFFDQLRSTAQRQANGATLQVGPVIGVLEVVMELFEEYPLKNNDLQLTPATGPSCWLLGAADDEFKEFMGKVIRHSIWSTLSAEMA